MEYLELVIQDLEDRVNEALKTLATQDGSTVSLAAATYMVSAQAQDAVKAEIEKQRVIKSGK